VKADTRSGLVGCAMAVVGIGNPNTLKIELVDDPSAQSAPAIWEKLE